MNCFSCAQLREQLGLKHECRPPGPGAVEVAGLANPEIRRQADCHGRRGSAAAGSPIRGGSRVGLAAHLRTELVSRTSSEGSAMPHSRHNRREFINATGAALAALAGAPALAIAQAAPAAAQAPGPAGRIPISIVVNAKVYTMDTRAPRAEAFAVTGGRFIAVGSHRRHQGPRRQEHADLRRQGHDRRARLHRLPQPRRRRGAAVRSAGRQSVRGRVRQHPQHRRQAARARRSRRRRARGSRATSSTTPR